MINYMLMLTKR